MARSKLELLKKYIHLVAVILGVAGLVATLAAADTDPARWLYSCISLGPIVMGLVTMLRYSLSAGDEKKIARAVTECGWVCLSFGLGFWMMLVSSYYAVPSGLAVILSLDALLLVAAGLFALVNVGKMGFSLTP